MKRLKRILDKADDLGMAVILGIFYFGQDERVKDEEAVKNAVDNTVDWVMNAGYRNVLIEVDNECNVNKYDHEILKPARIHELIDRVKARTVAAGAFSSARVTAATKCPRRTSCVRPTSCCCMATA